MTSFASGGRDAASSDTVGGIDTSTDTSTDTVGGRGDRPVETLRADVARAVEALDGLAERGVDEHVVVYERLHAVLGEALSAGPDRV